MFLELHPCPKNGVSEATCRLGGAEVTAQRRQGRWETPKLATPPGNSLYPVVDWVPTPTTMPLVMGDCSTSHQDGGGSPHPLNLDQR